MFGTNSSLIDFKKTTSKNIEDFFLFVDRCKNENLPPKNLRDYAILAFFEASTRTRLSFEAACARVGIVPMIFDGGINSSLEKGETVEDSIYNMAAMSPRLMIVRCGQSVDLPKFAQKFSFPILNAGWGVSAHPSQALLDLYTLRKYWNSFAGKKLLIVGDVKHSRVVASHRELARTLGIQIAQCGPKEFRSEDPQLLNFEKLEEGLPWADAVMALRFQFERHGSSEAFDKDDYRKKYGINLENFARAAKHCLLLHPGPINHGIELETEVLSIPQCKVLEQVHHGVFVREALIRISMGESHMGSYSQQEKK